MGTITTTDGTEIFYKDWGSKDAQPIVFHHGWPLSADDWDAQLMFFLNQGYRVVAHDRRGHGRSTQTPLGHDMDTYAADAAAVVEHLDLRDAVHVGQSSGLDDHLAAFAGAARLSYDFSTGLGHPRLGEVAALCFLASFSGGDLSGEGARDLLARAAAAGHEAVCVSHQLPIWTLRRFLAGDRLWHNPARRQCALGSVTTLTFDDESLVDIGYAEPSGSPAGTGTGA